MKQIQSKLTSYMYFYNQLMGLEKINSQPDITLGGQVTDAELKAQAGYYQFLVWAVFSHYNIFLYNASFTKIATIIFF